MRTAERLVALLLGEARPQGQEEPQDGIYAHGFLFGPNVKEPARGQGQHRILTNEEDARAFLTYSEDHDVALYYPKTNRWQLRSGTKAREDRFREHWRTGVDFDAMWKRIEDAATKRAVRQKEAAQLADLAKRKGSDPEAADAYYRLIGKKLGWDKAPALGYSGDEPVYEPQGAGRPSEPAFQVKASEFKKKRKPASKPTAVQTSFARQLFKQ